MAYSGLVSVITPTWQRHDMLLDRCMPSVQAQDYLKVQHVIVSDGPDPELRRKLPQDVVYSELPEHDWRRHWGNPARRHGIDIAEGEFITYCDDDDALRPEHCSLLVQALQDNPQCEFALSRMLSHQPSGDHVIGGDVIAFGQVGTPMIMHRRSILEKANWGVDSDGEDWELVMAWVNAGAKYARVDTVTVDVWPSTFR